MTGYHEDHPRDLFQTCPGCQAEIARDIDQCQFCDHQIDQGQNLPADFDPVNHKSAATETKSSRYSVILALNIATGLLGILAASLHEQPEWNDSRQNSGFRQVERDELVQLLQLSHEIEPEDRRTEASQMISPRPTVIHFSFQSGDELDQSQISSLRGKDDSLE